VSSLFRISLSMIFQRDVKSLMGLYESTLVGDFPGFGIIIISPISKLLGSIQQLVCW